MGSQKDKRRHLVELAATKLELEEVQFRLKRAEERSQALYSELLDTIPEAELQEQLRVDISARKPANHNLAKKQPPPTSARQPITPKERVQAPARPAATPKPASKIKPNAAGRCVVYTASTAGYDTLKVPLDPGTQFDYVCFTDAPTPAVGPWNIRQLDYIHNDPVRTARFAKTHPHLFFPDYEFSIWIDANLLLKQNPEPLLDVLKDANFSAFTHPHRDDVYTEAKEIIERGGLDVPSVIKEQMERYQAEGYKADNGLIETNVLLRRHNDPKIIDINNRWWKEMLNGSKRDQLSLPYVLAATNSKVKPLHKKGISVRNHPTFERFQHGEKSTYRPPAAVPASTPAQRPLTDAFGETLEEAATDAEAQVRHLGVTLDVVVCVHNSLSYVRPCLDSVRTSLLSRHRIIVVDDGSGPETATYLDELAQSDSRVHIVRRAKAGGYTKAANAGLRESTADFVILLNSDTLVPKDFWRKLADAALRSPHTGIVGPISNAASWQSVPEILKDKKLAVNERPEDLTIEDMDAIAAASAGYFPRVDLLNGFCLGIKRSVLDAVGELDEESFPKGYGEENDFCFRAIDAGFGLVVVPNCYVFHAKSKSYTPKGRDALAAEGSRAFRKKYPAHRIGAAIESTKYHPELVLLRERFKENVDTELARRQERREKGNLLRRLTTNKTEELSWFDLSAAEVAANRQLTAAYEADPGKPPQRVLWFVPQFEHVLKGGIRTIFSIAENFSKEFGTKNTFALYGKPPEQAPTNSAIQAVFPDLKFELLNVADGTDPADLPATDIAFCTLWNSAYLLAKYTKCRGKFYLAQDYEPVFFEAGTTSALVEQSYRLGMTAIANSLGVAQSVSEHSPTVGFFTPGVDHQQFGGRSSTPQTDPKRVVFYGRPGNPRNAFDLGAEVLRNVKRECGDDVQLISVGAEFDPRAHNLDGIVECWGLLPTMQSVADLYRSATAGLVFMYSAHPSYQPLEFMASGCVTVTNTNPSNTWILDPDRNAAVCESIPVQISDSIVRILRDSDYHQQLREGGFATAQKLDWDLAYQQVRAFVTNPKKYALQAGSAPDPWWTPEPPSTSGSRGRRRRS